MRGSSSKSAARSAPPPTRTTASWCFKVLLPSISRLGAAAYPHVELADQVAARIIPFIRGVQLRKPTPGTTPMGRSRGGLTSKIHAVVDTNGLPVHLALTPGEAHDNRLCFKSACHFAAWIGLTPKDHSSGGKSRPGTITRAGDQALRNSRCRGDCRH